MISSNNNSVEYLLITKEDVGNVFQIWFSLEDGIYIEPVKDLTQLPYSIAKGFNFISEEEYNSKLEEERRIHAKNCIEQAKEYLQVYPDLA